MLQTIVTFMEHPDIFQTGMVINHLSDAHVDPDSAEVLGAAFDALPDAFYLFDTSKRLSRVNHAGSRLEGPASTDLIGRRCCQMFWRVEGASECLVERAL